MAVQARSVRSFQSTAGNRAVADLVSRQRRVSAATPGPVIQRKLIFDNEVYGPGDQAQLAKETLPGSEQHLPGWTNAQLTSDAYFVLNETMTEWVLDPGLTFYRTKGGQRPGKTTSSANSPTLLDDIGFNSGAADRVGPKHPAGKTVKKVSILKNNDNGHWSLDCVVERGDGKTTKPMKIDLVATGYRLNYGAVQARGDTIDEFEFDLPEAVPVADVYRAMAAVAKERGHYSLAANNCRVFAHAMREKLAIMSLALQ